LLICKEDRTNGGEHLRDELREYDPWAAVWPAVLPVAARGAHAKTAPRGGKLREIQKKMLKEGTNSKNC
jgi:hypothetical protein